MASLAGTKDSGFSSARIKWSHLMKVKRCFHQIRPFFFFNFTFCPLPPRTLPLSMKQQLKTQRSWIFHACSSSTIISQDTDCNLLLYVFSKASHRLTKPMTHSPQVYPKPSRTETCVIRGKARRWEICSPTKDSPVSVSVHLPQELPVGAEHQEEENTETEVLLL